jgi:hypothetical protein
MVPTTTSEMLYCLIAQPARWNGDDHTLQAHALDAVRRAEHSQQTQVEGKVFDADQRRRVRRGPVVQQ